MLKIIFAIALVIPVYFHGAVLTIETNNWKRLPNISWNGSTPLAVDAEVAEHLELSAYLDGMTLHLTKTKAVNFEKIQYIYTPPFMLTNQEKYKIKVTATNKKIFNSYHIEVERNTETPKLNIVTVSPTVTHGGSGLVVIESLPAKELNFLGLIDEKGVVYYPQTFIKDGFYTTLFSWYSDYSTELSKKYILAIDNAGNTNTVTLNTKPVLRKYVSRTINLPPDYAKQKAKELNLDAEKAKKLEGDINAINTALNVKTVSRWHLTRKTSFKDSAKNVVKEPKFFSSPEKPMLKAINTATYGDKRKYVYKKKVVRESVHRGLDWASVKNAPIYALMDGTIAYADWNGGNGKTVYIDHGLGVYSMYAHNEEFFVKEGDVVKAGDQISISGTTGQSTGDHLHLSVIVQGMYVEPTEWLSEKKIDKLIHEPLMNAKEYIESKEEIKINS